MSYPQHKVDQAAATMRDAAAAAGVSEKTLAYGFIAIDGALAGQESAFRAANPDMTLTAADLVDMVVEAREVNRAVMKTLLS